MDGYCTVSVQFRANKDLLVYNTRFSSIRHRYCEPILSGGNENNPKLLEVKLQKRMRQLWYQDKKNSVIIKYHSPRQCSNSKRRHKKFWLAVGNGHCFKLAVFRFLTKTANKNKEANNGKIAKVGNSGTVGDGEGEGEVAVNTMDTSCVLKWVVYHT